MEEIAIIFSAFYQSNLQATRSADKEDRHSASNAEILARKMSWTVSDNVADLLFEGHSSDPANIFRTPAWLDCWIKLVQKHQDTTVKILIGSLSGKAAVAIPLAVTKGKFTTSVEFIAQDVCDYNGAVIHEDFGPKLSPELINLFVGQIRHHFPEADYVDLRKALLPSFSPSSNTVQWQKDLEKSHLCTLSGDWEKDVEQFIGGTSKKSLKRKLKKLQKMGSVTFAEITKPAEQEKAVRKLCVWKAGQLQELGTANIFEYGIFSEFLISSVTCGNNQLVRLFGMFVDEEPIALVHMLCSDDRWFLYQTAFTPEPAGKNSPGLMLVLDVLERACRDNVPIFDFGWGNEPYKQRFSTESLTLYNAFLPLSAKGRLVAIANSSKTAVKNFVKSNRYIRSIATLYLRWIARFRKAA